MKRMKLKNRFIALFAVISLVFANLSGINMRVSAATGKSEPTFKQTSDATLLVGESYQLAVSNKPVKASYVWTSSNKKVAAVNKKGLVKAISKGTAKITCKIKTNGQSKTLKATIHVKTKSSNPAKKVKINNKITSMAVGQTYDLNCTYSPKNAKEAVRWTSSNTNVATVSSKGVVKAKAKGNVTIKATALNGKKSDKVVIKISSAVTVANQKQLESALKAKNASTITISSKKAIDVVIPEGNYEGKKLIVNLPEGSVENYGIFKEITIKAIKGETWHEFAKNNKISVKCNANIIVEKDAESEIIIDKENVNVKVTAYGEAKVDIKKACSVAFAGTAKVNVEVSAKNVKITTAIALNINASEKFTIELTTKEAAATKVTVTDESKIPEVVGDEKLTVVVGGKEQTIGKDTKKDNTPGQTTSNGGTTIVPSTSTTTSTGCAISVSEKGFDAQGRVVACYGTPNVDGEIDEIWSKTPAVTPKYVNPKIKAKATFKTLWDDNALYILATVKDPDMTVASTSGYEQDSLELFLDENHDRAKEYGADDLHFRVNYENKKTADAGDITRFYTKTKVVDGGYQIEARIALKSKPANDKVYGYDLQINDASGTSRIGTTNIFDATGNEWQDSSLFGDLILTGKCAGAVTALNPYDLLAFVDSETAKLDPKNFTNYSVLTDAIKVANEVIADKNCTQAMIDAQIAKIKEAIAKLQLTPEAANEKNFTPVPDSYKDAIKEQGSIVSLNYEADNKAGTGKDKKKVNVYLPYGYDQNDKTTKYNVYYLMHGGGENTDTLFGGEGKSTTLSKILDHMIANGDIEPMIVVTPSFYGGKDDIATFHEEFVSQVMPLVESTYNTYAKSTSLKDLKASRAHRAFGGFSMGSACTWYMYIHCLDYIKYFTPFSGECWAYNNDDPKPTPDEVTAKLAQVAKDGGYTAKDFYLFCATGTADIAYPNMNPLMQAMKKSTEMFKYSKDKNKGNFYFIQCDGATHAWNWVNQYVYDVLPDLFDVDQGFNEEGKAVASFGTPKIDGTIDEVWNKAATLVPVAKNGTNKKDIQDSAKVKVLWDDNAIYVLAQVKDNTLDASSNTVYNQDCIELFLDEEDDGKKVYGSDDVQFRVNYKNKQSADHGSLDRFYTCTKEVDGGYIIEARIALQKEAKLGNQYGFEMQLSDAVKGNRIATYHLFDKTGMAFDDTALFGKLVLANRAEGDVCGLNPYDLMNLVVAAKEIKLKRYTNGDEVQKLIDASEAAIKDEASTQAQINELYTKLDAAVEALIPDGKSYEDKECRRIPERYKITDEHQGTIEKLSYKTNTYDEKDSRDLEKYCNVYLPEGYDPQKQYDIVYLIHGMGENQNTVFGGPGQNLELMKILDNMIYDGKLKPMIVVTPTWQVEGSKKSMFELVENFHNELEKDLIPAVESKYHTHAVSGSALTGYQVAGTTSTATGSSISAKDITNDVIKASRNHRACAGFSMGSGCTWYNYINCVDDFKYFMPMSLWCLQDMSQVKGEGTEDQKKAQFLANVALSKGYGPKDVYFFCATGTDDMAYGGMVSQVAAMKEVPSMFKYTADLSKGNFYFMTLEGGTHSWNCVNRYLYNMLPDLFTK